VTSAIKETGDVILKRIQFPYPVLLLGVIYTGVCFPLFLFVGGPAASSNKKKWDTTVGDGVEYLKNEKLEHVYISKLGI